jgi:uncharacterized protein
MSNDTGPQAGEFCWNELMTSDTKMAGDFYSSLFGWSAQEMPMGDMTYTMLMQGEKPIGGMMQIPADKAGFVPPHWISYILVDDLEKTLEKAQGLGAAVVVPIRAAGDMGRLAVIQDPTGAHIAFWKPNKA